MGDFAQPPLDLGHGFPQLALRVRFAADISLSRACDPVAGGECVVVSNADGHGAFELGIGLWGLLISLLLPHLGEFSALISSSVRSSTSS